MPPDFWALLAEPFLRSSCTWRVVEVADDLQTARLARTLAGSAVSARLDRSVGQDNWSYQLLPMGERTLVCNLSVSGVSRAGTATVARGLSDFDAATLADEALAAAAERFGMTAGSEAIAWVEFDAEAGEPLYLPEEDHDDVATTEVADTEAPGRVPAGTGLSPADAVPLGTPPATSDPVRVDQDVDQKPAGHEVIERLLDRLREEGLGRDAARLVVTYGGYGRSQTEARELYGKLRALLLSAATAPTS